MTPMLTTDQAELYRRCLPMGETQGRIIRGEEDANLAAIIEVLTLVVERLRREDGKIPGSRGDSDIAPGFSLHDTIECAKRRQETLRRSEESGIRTDLDQLPAVERSHPAFLSFAAEMRGRAIGGGALTEAWHYFKAGWDARKGLAALGWPRGDYP